MLNAIEAKCTYVNVIHLVKKRHNILWQPKDSTGFVLPLGLSSISDKWMRFPMFISSTVDARDFQSWTISAFLQMWTPY